MGCSISLAKSIACRLSCLALSLSLLPHLCLRSCVVTLSHTKRRQPDCHSFSLSSGSRAKQQRQRHRETQHRHLTPRVTSLCHHRGCNHGVGRLFDSHLSASSDRGDREREENTLNPSQRLLMTMSCFPLRFTLLTADAFAGSHAAAGLGIRGRNQVKGPHSFVQLNFAPSFPPLTLTRGCSSALLPLESPQ